MSNFAESPSQWLNSIFAFSTSLPPTRDSGNAPELALNDHISALYRHEAMLVGRSDSIDELLRFHRAPSFISDNLDRFTWQALCNAIESSFSGKLRLRTQGVMITSKHQITSSYMPTHHNMLPRIVSKWSRMLSEIDESSDQRTSAVAFAAWFSLLTIHPFSDRNGRFARLLYSILLSRWRCCSTGNILALTVVLADGGRRFHPAAGLARQGEFDELFALLADARERAASVYAHAVAHVSSALDANDRTALAKALEQLRNEVLAVLMPLQSTSYCAEEYRRAT